MVRDYFNVIAFDYVGAVLMTPSLLPLSFTCQKQYFLLLKKI